ncbi:MAG TPA: hypothetical protein VIL16_27890 [Trebonia sp.]
MSAVLQTVIGAVAAIAGGFLVAWWQTSRADTIARTIRRAERREEGLLELNEKVTEVHDAIERVYSAAEHGQSTSQYQNARQELNGLHVFWDGRSVGVIPDQAVIDAYRTIIARPRTNVCPAGSWEPPVRLSYLAATKTSANASSAIWAKYSGS